MKPKNLLLIMSDEHDPRYLGINGHPVIQTPALDRLAARGTRFSNAYTPSPICVPTRASFATGKYVNRLPYWDNAMGYDGRVKGWGHCLQDAGISVEAIGKLHYRHKDDPLGFDRQVLPMHLKDGVGQVWGSIRDPLPEIPAPRMFNRIGAGVSNYNLFDRQVANEACEWLRTRGEKSRERDEAQPWTLFVGLTAPHFPLTVPRNYLDRYPPECVPPRKLHPRDGYRHHPWIEAQERYMSQEGLFADEDERILGIRSYYGLCTFLDDQIGLILDALEEFGLAETTRVIYTSDHGDNLGSRGLWGKSNLYEESTKIPLIMAGPDIPEDHVSNTPVSLVDFYPTILEGMGLDLGTVQQGGEEYPGRSLFEVATAPDDLERMVISEYHAVGSVSGAFMLRKGRYKFHYYVGLQPELFDLENDPEETIDLAGDPAYSGVIAELELDLRSILDPEEVDGRAKAAQAALIESYGGREEAIRKGAIGATPVPGKEDE